MIAEPDKVTVIGAGLMGHAIAYVMANAGHSVRVFDRSTEALASLPDRLAGISQLFGHDGQAASRVSGIDDIAVAAEGAGFVIEAAAENLQVKQFIVAELEAVLSPEAIIASNTSAIPITQIADKALHANRIVGAHFWNPPHLVKLVEVVQADKTSEDTVNKTLALMSGAGHHAVHVRKDVPGFIGNRLQHALKREAIALVADGICDAETVDDVVKHGFGKRLGVIGPLEQSDMVGLELTEAIHATLMPALDTTETVHPYLAALVAQGDIGMKSGKGFRSWTPETAEAVRQRLRDFLSASAGAD